MRWSDLKPEPEIVAALAHAGQRPENGTQDQKRDWSARFAHRCAVGIAEHFRRTNLRIKRIQPRSIEEGTEPLTPLGSGTSKRIDVTIADQVLGLEVGISLKGLNFRDRGNNNFDKNLTGRLYELGDEVRLVHEHLPHAFMVGVFFLPMDATADKGTSNAPSSFAHTVIKLRERTGRLDAALAGQAPRCDAGYVALYTIGAEPQGFPPGLVRFFDVKRNPPRRGRPKIEDSLSLDDVVDQVVTMATFSTKIAYEEPEQD